jgi:metastasis-associated protein MTA
MSYFPLSLRGDSVVSSGESDNRNQQKMEMKVWDPDNPLTDRQIDQFLVVAR